MIRIDHAAYLRSWAAELASQSDRVRNLIGPAHWLTDGRHKEEILKDFIRRYVPPALIVSGGFVVSLTGSERCSPELDIIIASPAIDAPLLHQSGVCIVTPECVLAHLQVKTKFAKDVFDSAIHNVAAAQRVICNSVEPSRVWRGVFFYESLGCRTADSILNTVEASIKSLIEDDAEKTRDPRELLPTCIVCLNQWVIFVAGGMPSGVQLRLFNVQEISAACALADFFVAVRRGTGGAVAGSLTDMTTSIIQEPAAIRLISIGA